MLHVREKRQTVFKGKYFLHMMKLMIVCDSWPQWMMVQRNAFNHLGVSTCSLHDSCGMWLRRTMKCNAFNHRGIYTCSVMHHIGGHVSISMQDCHVMWFCRELGSCGIPSNNINSGASTAEPSICIRVAGVGWWVGVFARGCGCYVLRLQLVVACAREKGCIWPSFSPFSRPCIPHPGSVFFYL